MSVSNLDWMVKIQSRKFRSSTRIPSIIKSRNKKFENMLKKAFVDIDFMEP